jgi:hypothetical protein
VIATMISAYFDFWAGFWGEVAETFDARERPVQWVVDFGAVRKNLADIHPQTGLPDLVAPTKSWIEQQLEGRDYSGLTVLFRVEPARGLTYALHGPARVVAKALQRLGR